MELLVSAENLPKNEISYIRSLNEVLIKLGQNLLKNVPAIYIESFTTYFIEREGGYIDMSTDDHRNRASVTIVTTKIKRFPR